MYRQYEVFPKKIMAVTFAIAMTFVFFFPPGSMGKKTTMTYRHGDVLKHIPTGKKLTVLRINCQLMHQRRGRCAVEARSHDNLSIGFYHPDEVTQDG